MGTQVQTDQDLQDELTRMTGIVKELRVELDRMKLEKEPESNYRKQIYHALAENSSEMIFIVDDEYNIRFINSSALKLAGREGEDVIGEAAGRVFPGKMHKVLSQGIKDVLRTEEPHIQEEVIKLTDEEIWLNTLFLPIITPGDPMVNVIVISRNVTEKRVGEAKIHQACVNLQTLFDDKVLDLQRVTSEMQQAVAERIRTEEELYQAKERYKALISNIPGAVYRCANDKYWTMEFISDRVEEISGYPASEFIRNNVRSFASIIIEDDLIPVADAVNRGVNAGKPYEMRYRIIDKNGEVHRVYEKGQGIFAKDGTLICLEGVIFDISHWANSSPEH